MRRNVSIDKVAVGAASQKTLPGKEKRLPWRLAVLVIAALSIAVWSGIAYLVLR